MIPTARLRRNLALGLFVLGSSAAFGPTADAETPTSLAGFDGTAAASGMHATYMPDGLLPTAPPVDLGAPDSLATITTGPTTFARSSVADPGDLFANPDALLALSGGGYKSGTVPPYPLRTKASYPSGAHEGSATPAPGVGGRAAADANGSRAEGTTPSLAGGGAITLGSGASQATTALSAPRVTVEATAEVSSMDLLGGLLHVDGLRSTAKATSDGARAQLGGGTTIAGASVLGQPVTIDAGGVHLRGAPPSAGGLLDPTNAAFTALVAGAPGDLNEALARVGITIHLAGPMKLEGQRGSSFTTAGLRIDFEFSPRTFPALAAVVKAIPFVPSPAPGAPGLSDAVALLRVRHLTALQVGGARVDLTATTAGPDFVDDLAALPPTPGTTAPELSLAAPATGEPGAAVAVQPAGTTRGPRDLPGRAGVAALALAGSLAVLVGGSRLAALAGWLLPAADTIACAEEER